MIENILAILIFIFWLAIFFITPHAFIGAINLFFGTAIAHTFTNWIAAFILIILTNLFTGND